jgi:hypothetical protein
MDVQSLKNAMVLLVQCALKPDKRVDDRRKCFWHSMNSGMTASESTKPGWHEAQLPGVLQAKSSMTDDKQKLEETFL